MTRTVVGRTPSPVPKLGIFVLKDPQIPNSETREGGSSKGQFLNLGTGLSISVGEIFAPFLKEEVSP